MKVNAPVSEVEYFVPEGVSLVTATDLRGRITYCNASFIEVSGFELPELLGSPHNIIRHPDMPAEVFTDLWATIQAGKPWQGTVKNRRKNGEFYWVAAHVTPMRDGDRVVGFLSVRSRPHTNAVLSAASLYARLRSQARHSATRIAVEGGFVRHPSAAGRIADLLLKAHHSTSHGPLLACGLAGALIGAGLGLVAALVLLPLISLLAWLHLHRKTFKAQESILRDANRLAAGDLTTPVRVEPDGAFEEIQRALAQVSATLKAVVLDTRSELVELEDIVQSVAQGNERLAARSVVQIQSLDAASRSLGQLTESTHRDIREARSGSILATNATDLTQAGHEATQTVAIAMDAIVSSSNEINDFVRFIDEVAFNTNLMAVNASVEAAKAGPGVPSFSTVAADIRELARGVQDASQQMRKLMDSTTARIRAGEASASRAIISVTTVMEQILQVRDMLARIQKNTAHHERDIDATTLQIGHLVEISHQNTSMTAELHAAAQEMHERLGELKSSMRVFRLSSEDRMVCEHEPGGATADARERAGGR